MTGGTVFALFPGGYADANADHAGFIEDCRIGRRFEKRLCGVLWRVLPG
jgi:hypothetical protein